MLLVVFTTALGIAPASRTAVSEPVPLDYVALGDSITAGHDLLGGSREGFVPRYEAFIEADTGVPADLVNLGVDGQSSSGLLRGLGESARVRHHVAGRMS